MHFGLRLGLTAGGGAGSDTVAPIVSIDAVSDTDFDYTSDEAGVAFYLINGSSTPLSGATIEAGGGDDSGSFSATAGTSSRTLYIAHLDTGTYYLHLTVKDAAGNYSEDVPQAFVHTYLGIQFVGGATNFATASAATFTQALNSLTGGIDTAARPKDIAVLITGIAAGSLLTAGVDTSASTGWTVELNPGANDVRDVRARNAYKIMGDTADTGVVCLAGANSSYSSLSAVMVFRGVHQTTPIDTTSLGNALTNGAAINSSSITPATDGAAVITMGMNTGTGTPTDITAAPSGFTDLVTAKRDTGSVDGNIAMAVKLGCAAAVAVDPGDFTGATLGIDDSAVGVSMVLKPAH